MSQWPSRLDHRAHTCEQRELYKHVHLRPLFNQTIQTASANAPNSSPPANKQAMLTKYR